MEDEKKENRQEMPKGAGYAGVEGIAQKEGRMRCGGIICIGRKARSRQGRRMGDEEVDGNGHGWDEWVGCDGCDAGGECDGWSSCMPKPAGRLAADSHRSAKDSEGLIRGVAIMAMVMVVVIATVGKRSTSRREERRSRI